MKTLTVQNFVVMLLACLSGGALLYTSQNVQTANDVLAAIQSNITKEQERIAVLEAEWEFLNSPQRLEKLAKEYYGVEKPSTSQMIGGNIDLPFPAPIENMPAIENAPGDALFVQPASLSGGGQP